MTGTRLAPPIEELLHSLAPAVLATVARRNQDFDLCEDAVQEALLAASRQWQVDGIPDNPRGWLITAATRRRIELLRSDTARRRRERVATETTGAGAPAPSARDDSLTLLFLCCHPALTPVSQVALTLRAVGGLTTAEIARALMVPESTVAQRISRAKARIRDSGARFTMPDEAQRPTRLAAVLHVLYLVFNEGYTASSGTQLHRVELSTEAMRLTRTLRTELPDVGEVAGLLALMLLTDARRAARTTAAGGLVPLAEQDRSRWNRTAIAEGTAILEATLPLATIGPYQIQAAIAAVHDEAPTAAEVDWPQILGLYDIQVTLMPGPMVTLNRIVALAMVHGPDVGLHALDRTAPRLVDHHRMAAVRAHLLELAGHTGEAHEHYELAARTTLNLAERRYLEARAAATGHRDIHLPAKNPSGQCARVEREDPERAGAVRVADVPGGPGVDGQLPSAVRIEEGALPARAGQPGVAGEPGTRAGEVAARSGRTLAVGVADRVGRRCPVARAVEQEEPAVGEGDHGGRLHRGGLPSAVLVEHRDGYADVPESV